MTSQKPEIFGALDLFERTIIAMRALENLIHDRLWREGQRRDADGIGELFSQQFDRLDAACDMLREDVKRLARQAPDSIAKPVMSSAERKAARIANIKLILRDTDYSLVAERYALPQETIRDILYAMMDAPQRVPTVEGLRDVGSGPLPEHLGGYEMTPVKPLQGLDEPLPEIDASEIANALNMREAAVKKVIERLRADNKLKGPPPAATGTDG